MRVDDYDFSIERILSREFAARLDEVKGLRGQGWDVTCVLSPDRKTVVIFGFRCLRRGRGPGDEPDLAEGQGSARDLAPREVGAIGEPRTRGSRRSRGRAKLPTTVRNPTKGP